jgi:hypothetical protein
MGLMEVFDLLGLSYSMCPACSDQLKVGRTILL